MGYGCAAGATSLPLLALKAADISAPFSGTRITFVIDFDPKAKGKDGSFGKATLTLTPYFKSLSPEMQLVATRLASWVSKGIVDTKGVGRPLERRFGREWSITWKDFNASIAQTTVAVNSPGGDSTVPYVLVDFNQTLVDNDGSQTASFVFDVDESILAKWLLSYP